MAPSTDKPYPPYPPTDVFFLGAGTSVSGGAPTFANFRNKAKDARSKMLENGESNLWRHFGVGFCKFKSVPMNEYITK